MVSVVIPDCKDGIYFQRCINSIRRQSIKDLEIIAVWPEGEWMEIPEVINITAGEDLVDTIKRVCASAKGEYIFFLSYYSVMSPNCMEELLKTGIEEDTMYSANEIYVGKKNVAPETIYSHFLQGRLYGHEMLNKVAHSLERTYCQAYYFWNTYKANFKEIKTNERAYYYTTLDDDDALRECEQIKYDNVILENTLKDFCILDEESKKYVENKILDNIKMDKNNEEELCEMVYSYRSDSFKLMMNYVISSYGKQYKNACRGLEQTIYDRVKVFLINLESEPELHAIALTKIGLSEDMYSAMKHLDVHNYKYVVEDNSLFIATVYPEGIKNLNGSELAEYVISRYSEGCLGAGTIIKSLKAWAGNKLKK